MPSGWYRRNNAVGFGEFDACVAVEGFRREAKLEMGSGGCWAFSREEEGGKGVGRGRGEHSCDR